jgi:acetyltransferase
MGILSGPGGLAVSASEACGRAGLQLANLSAETQAALKKIIPPTGTSTKNPVDVGLMASLDMSIYIESARTVVTDPNVDALVVIGAGMSPEINQTYTSGLIDVQQACSKPILVVKIPGFEKDLAAQFCEAGIPFFDSAERAMRTYAAVKQYQDWRKFSCEL